MGSGCVIVKFKDLQGLRFGKLLVRQLCAERTSKGGTRWKCSCDCGNESTVDGTNLSSGNTMSCGCLRNEKKTKHNLCKTAVYEVWCSMKNRVFNINAQSFRNYGGRGVTVCDRWNVSFQNFMDDMGPRPKGGTLERRDNNNGYSKDNCHWATAKEQANNRRTNVLVDGLTMSQHVEKNSLDYNAFYYRYRTMGCSIEEATRKSRKNTVIG